MFTNELLLNNSKNNDNIYIENIQYELFGSYLKKISENILNKELNIIEQN